MLVYGDDERQVRANETAQAIAARLLALEHKAGLARHEALVAALIETGELVQGVADAEFAERGVDELSPMQSAGARLLMMLARIISASWESGFGHAPEVPAECFELFDRLGRAGHIRLRRPEGYAFYALYPDAYLEAARRSGLGPDTIVIGIRSIGTSLSAMVASGLGAAAPVTVRPVGHPYQRQIAVGPALAEHMLRDRNVPFAIVDEGPGLSGSSFGGVLDWLEERGIARHRCHVFPHGEAPGPQAQPSHRKRWREIARHRVSFEELLLGDGPGRLEQWISGIVGPLTAPLEDLSGGAWRARQHRSEVTWPPVDMQLERRKFLAHSKDGAWLVKFAGLGAIGEQKLALARSLADAGFTVRPTGLAHGFLVEPWVEAEPLDSAAYDRERLVMHLGAYLGFRAGLTAPAPGASLEELFTMAVHNTREALGAAVADRVEALLGDPLALASRVRPVMTDNRLHAFEWLVDPQGRLIKTDALDHHAAHDLVGGQDIAWDIAGAAVEFALSPAERRRLTEETGRRGARPIDPDLVRVLEPCYVAFQIGLWTFAAGSAPNSETKRIESALNRYTARLHSWLEEPLTVSNAP